MADYIISNQQFIVNSFIRSGITLDSKEVDSNSHPLDVEGPTNEELDTNEEDGNSVVKV